MAPPNLRVVQVAPSEKHKALAIACAQIDKLYGKGSVMRLGDSPKALGVDIVSSGSLGLDLALGIGGLPRGRIVEIFGPESSGKTTLALHALAEVQRQGGVCGFIDAEHALDTDYAQALGVKSDDLILTQPDHGEQALDTADMLVRSGGMDALVIDSVAALVPRAELEGDMDKEHMGGLARLMGKGLRKLTGSISRSRCTVIFINQLRQKIGVQFGNPETTTGGNALKYQASIRLDVRHNGSKLKDGDEAIGMPTRVRVVKNKLAPPFREATFDVVWGQGISRTGELVDLGVKFGIVEKSGAWLSYGGEHLGQGRENAKTFLAENPKVAAAIEGAIRSSATAEDRDASTDGLVS